MVPPRSPRLQHVVQAAGGGRVRGLRDALQVRLQGARQAQQPDLQLHHRHAVPAHHHAAAAAAAAGRAAAGEQRAEQDAGEEDDGGECEEAAEEAAAAAVVHLGVGGRGRGRGRSPEAGGGGGLARGARGGRAGMPRPQELRDSEGRRARFRFRPAEGALLKCGEKVERLPLLNELL